MFDAARSLDVLEAARHDGAKLVGRATHSAEELSGRAMHAAEGLVSTAAADLADRAADLADRAQELTHGMRGWLENAGRDLPVVPAAVPMIGRTRRHGLPGSPTRWLALGMLGGAAMYWFLRRRKANASKPGTTTAPDPLGTTVGQGNAARAS